MAATGREARAERLNDRLRGAQRVQIEDESFSLDIQGFSLPAPAPPAPAFESPSSAKRRRLDPSASPRNAPGSGGSARGSGGSLRRSPRSSARRDPYDLPSASKESEVEQVAPSDDEALVPEPDEADLSVARVIAALESGPLTDLDELDEPSVLLANAGSDGPLTGRTEQNTGDRFDSMRSKRVPSRPSQSQAHSSGYLARQAKSNDVHQILEPSSAPNSSPSQAKARRISSAASAAPSDRTSMGSARRASRSRFEQSARSNEVDELSPDRPRDQAPAQSISKDVPKRRVVPAKTTSPNVSSGSPEDDVDELSPSRSQEGTQADELATTARPGRSPKQLAQPEEVEEAEEIDEAAAAAALGRTRRRGRPSKSTQAGSREAEGELEEEPNDTPENPGTKKRKRGRPSTSPATQKQPAAKQRAKTAPTAAKPRTSSAATNGRPAISAPKRTSSPKTQQRRASDDGENAAFEVTVQRFVHHKSRAKKADTGAEGDSDAGEGVDEDADPLQLEIPFANRTAESAVDVFAQLCEEVIGNMMAQFEEHLRNAPDATRKKELKVKLRAVEAYREELNLRLLEHAIHLNNWYTLRKRVRQAQKEKMVLRDEILRLRAEREQVALRMDAVRIKHEKETKESSFLLDTSSLMRDIDQAVTEGRDAPELPPKVQKEAELVNLELVVAQVAEQVSRSAGGGMLDQLQDFNAFLERAAVALESR